MLHSNLFNRLECNYFFTFKKPIYMNYTSQAVDEAYLTI